jgi:hypothetical protein
MLRVPATVMLMLPSLFTARSALVVALRITPGATKAELS